VTVGSGLGIAGDEITARAEDPLAADVAHGVGGIVLR
jgi:hypothetical protein